MPKTMAGGKTAKGGSKRGKGPSRAKRLFQKGSEVRLLEKVSCWPLVSPCRKTPQPAL